MNWSLWLQGLISALISGAATSFLSVLGISGAEAVGVHVTQFDWKQLAVITAMGGLVGAAAYLKQSPVPKSVPALLLCVSLFTGCAAIQSIDWARVLGAVANAGLTMVLRNNPQAAQWIGLTQSVLDSFIEKKAVDLSRLERDLKDTSPEWREAIRIALDEASSKLGTALSESERLELLEHYLRSIRAGVSTVGKPASVNSREYQKAREILRERGFKVSQFPASRGFATAIPNTLPAAEIPGWKRLWLPVVPWFDCPVTPDKMELGPIGKQMVAANAIARY